MTNDERDAIESIRTAIVLSPYDWAANQKLAWVYGIIVGWSEKGLAELAKQHNWDEARLARLKQFRAALCVKAPTPAHTHRRKSPPVG